VLRVIHQDSFDWQFKPWGKVMMDVPATKQMDKK
jgi:hypothetical protein